MRKKTAGFVKEKNGTWTIEGKIKIDGEYKHYKSRGYSTLAEAKENCERVKNEFICKHGANNPTSFKGLVDEYLKTRSLICDESTVYADKLLIKNYIYPTFKYKQTKEAFDKLAFSSWCNTTISSVKISANKKKKIMTRMKDILKFAYMHKYIDASMYQDCDICILPVKDRSKKEERVAWTLEEQQAFLEAIDKDSVDYIMFRLFLALGTRLGEFLGLMPKCFDYNKRRVKIFQQVKYNGNGGYTLTDKLKTNDSYRSIIIDFELAEMLYKYIQEEMLQNDDFLFGRNKPLSRTEFRRKLYKWEDRAQVRRAVPHAIRHSSAKLLASVCTNASDIEVAAKRLGHSAEVFLKVYANHTDEETEESLLNKINTLRTDA